MMVASRRLRFSFGYTAWQMVGDGYKRRQDIRKINIYDDGMPWGVWNT